LLRFGDDDYGQAPQPSAEQTKNPFYAIYRVGNGVDGNVGRETISRILVSPVPTAGSKDFPVWVVPAQLGGEGITKVRNPIEAQGGVEPESIEDVQQFAPQAFRNQKRAVTTSDYESILLGFPGVVKAFAERKWTGSWWTYFISVDRTGGRPVDRSFKQAVLDFLDGYRLAGYDLEITGPLYASLDIQIHVCLSPGFQKGDVERRLLAAFSNKVLSDGTKGFFYPDNFTFGQPVYLSRVYARALSVVGVSSAEALRFQRWGKRSENEITSGVIQIAPSEIARLDNDSNFQENGIIKFTFDGGL
jgi:predicted phage baseplate assembly protein